MKIRAVLPLALLVIAGAAVVGCGLEEGDPSGDAGSSLDGGAAADDGDFEEYDGECQAPEDCVNCDLEEVRAEAEAIEEEIIAMGAEGRVVVVAAYRDFDFIDIENWTEFNRVNWLYRRGEVQIENFASRYDEDSLEDFRADFRRSVEEMDELEFIPLDEVEELFAECDPVLQLDACTIMGTTVEASAPNCSIARVDLVTGESTCYNFGCDEEGE